jgi:signal transduction histidine kinase
MPSTRPGTQASSESRSAQLLLIEPTGSPFLERIANAARKIDLQVTRVDSTEQPPADGTVVGIGPSVSNPVQIARQVRGLGGQPLLVFFTASPGARAAIEAELVRDPFISERYELIEITADRAQLARRIGQAEARVERAQRARTRLRRTAPRSRKTNNAANPIVCNDTSHQQIEEALCDANRQKDEFLAIMSHELRTPLTSILGYTDMLLRGLAGELEPRSTRYVANVRAAGDRLLELVNGLLDFTRLESGAEHLAVRPLDITQVVKQVCEKCTAAAESKQIAMRVHVREPVVTVIGDEEKLHQVLRHYISNAIKFTPEGGEVTMHIGRDPRHPDRARVEVSDSGIGMRDEQVAHVWDRFYQGDASLTRPYGGMGLGLSIARHLVQLHGGDVGAESQGPGRGSTFWFTLPLR